MSQNLLVLKDKIYKFIRELETPDGFNASGKEEVYGCIFGRDSFITILKILKSLNIKDDPYLLSLCKKSLLTHIGLQGKEINIESGEQPGKFIHEYRIDKYERLTKNTKPWYVYPDKILRNYDSIDATPLGLIAIYKYYEKTKDNNFLLKTLPAVEKGLEWIVNFGDMDDDYLLEYELPKNRKHGGLPVQSWADSVESLRNAEGNLPQYPISAVEVQGIAWLALKLWGNFFLEYYKGKETKEAGHALIKFANNLKKRFNEAFLIKNNNKYYLAQALDGDKNQISTITSHPLLCLWAAYKNGNSYESIIDEKILKDVVNRTFEADIFLPHAGIRTMSSLSPTFNPYEHSYHNGSFWPMLNGLILEGLENFGFKDKAKKLTEAMLAPIQHFGTPIELYIEKDGTYFPFKDPMGQVSCMNQAWSAAAIYEVLVNLTTTSNTI